MIRPIVRRAGRLDCAHIATLLNEVIAQGGTTALTNPVTGADIAAWMARSPRAIWHLAEDDAGTLLGFQYIEPHATFGDHVAQIATFARVGRTGLRTDLGIGSALFEATAAAARQEGYAWINAEIRADNTGGLIYYQSRGFEDYGGIDGYSLGDGTRIDKLLKRYDL